MERAGFRAPGFSLIEMLVTLSVLALVIAALATVLIHATLARLGSTNRFESLQTSRAALDMIARDLRSAGYGVDAGNGAGAQPAIAYVDSMQILMCENQLPYPDASGAGTPQAYAPAGSPRPQPLIGSQWTPPVKYGTGAEIIRYTLDLNDDGQVNASDVASSEGADARRTRQQDDYTLVREVFGDRSGGTPGNNGGSPERIALVLKPGGSVAPLFSVFLNGSATPWNWSNGPVPSSQLSQITRVEVNVTASSPGPDANGSYTITPLVGDVLLQRNAPNFGSSTYTVDGYVYEDDNLNRVLDQGESGLAGAAVRLGSGRIAYTSSSGYYSFRVPSGTYLLKHAAPSGFGSFSNPDSFTVSVAGPETRSFADTLRTGGWVTLYIFTDTNANGVQDGGEGALASVTLTLTPGGTQATTDANGAATLFAPAGSWSVSATPPSGYSLTTSNPVSGTMASGGSASRTFGMQQAANGTITGRVFVDQNSDGTYNGTDFGMASITVSVKDAAGATTIATGTSDGAGAYSISVPQSGGSTYQVVCPSQTGYAATTTLAYTGVTVSSGQTVSGKDFGFAGWTSSSLSTGAVVCLAVADVWENDGSGGVPNTRQDADLLVSHTDAVAGKVGLWANAYPTATPFADTAAVNVLFWMTTAPTALVSDSVVNLAAPSAPYVMMGFPSSVSNNWAYAKRTAAAAWPSVFTTKTANQTNDEGTVNVVKMFNMDGGVGNDLILGTKDPDTNGKGTMVIYHGTFSGGNLGWSSAQTYPNKGSMPDSAMGEVTGIGIEDIDGDGKRDLVVATKLGSTSGAIRIFQFNGYGAGDWFTWKATITLSGEAAKAIAVGDFDGDGRNDFAIGTSSSSTAGRVLVYRNTYGSGAWTFSQTQAFSAPGAVTTIAAGELDGASGTDVIIGYCSSTSSYLGGARIYSNNAGSLSTSGSDPTNGGVTRWVTSIALGNFNYGTSPSTPSAPYLTDLAIGWKQSTTLGGVTILVR